MINAKKTCFKIKGEFLIISTVCEVKVKIGQRVGDGVKTETMVAFDSFILILYNKTNNTQWSHQHSIHVYIHTYTHTSITNGHTWGKRSTPLQSTVMQQINMLRERKLNTVNSNLKNCISMPSYNTVNCHVLLLLIQYM